MRTLVVTSGLFVSLALCACDTGQPSVAEQMNKTKKPSELKQTTKTEMTPEELAEARKKAGFVDPEEQMAEARAIYEREEKAFVKGRLETYRTMLQDLRKSLDEVEKGAAKWAKAKSPDAAFTKFNEGYAADNKDFIKAYRELTDKETRGGEVQVKLGAFITSWENFNGDLGGKIAENEKFAPTLETMRKALTELDGMLDAIEKDETIEAQPPKDAPQTKGKKKSSR